MVAVSFFRSFFDQKNQYKSSGDRTVAIGDGTELLLNRMLEKITP